jgi:hypothetical protein
MVEQPMLQQRGTGTSGNTAAGVPSSAWSPFRSTAFTVLWLATLVSNVGVWMQNAAAGWLMTGFASLATPRARLLRTARRVPIGGICRAVLSTTQCSG